MIVDRPVPASSLAHLKAESLRRNPSQAIGDVRVSNTAMAPKAAQPPKTPAAKVTKVASTSSLSSTSSAPSTPAAATVLGRQTAVWTCPVCSEKGSCENLPRQVSWRSGTPPETDLPRRVEELCGLVRHLVQLHGKTHVQTHQKHRMVTLDNCCTDKIRRFGAHAAKWPYLEHFLYYHHTPRLYHLRCPLCNEGHTTREELRKCVVNGTGRQRSGSGNGSARGARQVFESPSPSPAAQKSPTLPMKTTLDSLISCGDPPAHVVPTSERYSQVPATETFRETSGLRGLGHDNDPSLPVPPLTISESQDFLRAIELKHRIEHPIADLEDEEDEEPESVTRQEEEIDELSEFLKDARLGGLVNPDAAAEAELVAIFKASMPELDICRNSMYCHVSKEKKIKSYEYRFPSATRITLVISDFRDKVFISHQSPCPWQTAQCTHIRLWSPVVRSASQV